MHLYEFYLYEGRAEHIAQNQGEKIWRALQKDSFAPPDLKKLDKNHMISVVKKIEEVDPFRGKSLQFLIKSYGNGKFKLEDLPSLKATLEDFKNNMKFLPKKQLGQYADVQELTGALHAFHEEDSGGELSQSDNMAKIEIRGDATLITKGRDFMVVVPNTEEAAIYYGKNTKWRTAYTTAQNQFDNHNAQGKLWTIFAGKKKFLLHMETDQFMNSSDIDLTKKDIAYLSNYPEYTAFINSLIDKYYA